MSKQNRKTSSKRKGAGEKLGAAVGHTADQAWSLASKALSLLNVEAKEVSAGYTGSSNVVDYNGLRLSATANISQGSSDSTRNGDSLKLVRLQGPFAFYRNGADAIVTLVVTRQGADYLTNFNQVFEAKGSSNAPLSLPDWDSRHGFTVLMRKTIRLTANDPVQIIDIDLRFDHDVQYVGGTTQVSFGAVDVWMISDLVTSNQPYVRATSQLSWYDN